jgi:hypothetical protein
MLFPPLATRQLEAEWMDEPDVDRARLRRSLSFICLINRMLGYTRATLWHFERLSRTWEPGQAIHVQDVATGSADIPRALAKWGRRRGFDLRIVGLDRHPLTARFADERTSDIPNIRIIRGDALSLPFACDTFDYVITNMFLHHPTFDTYAADKITLEDYLIRMRFYRKREFAYMPLHPSSPSASAEFARSRVPCKSHRDN